MTSPSRPASSSGLRTSTTSAPSARSIVACSRKFPCTARTPIRSRWTAKLVAPGARTRLAVSLATGERPSALSLGGAAAALAGAVLASAEERRSPAQERVRAVSLALLAAVALGLFTYFLGLGSREGSPLSTLVGARTGSLSLLVTLALARGAPLLVGRRWLAPVAAIGL